MHEEGVIDKETANTMMDYSIIVTEKGLLGRMYDYLFTEKNIWRFRVVKVLKSKYDEQ